MQVTQRLNKAIRISLFLLLLTFAYPNTVYADQVTIDKSEAVKGIIKVSCNVPGDQKIKMIIQKDDQRYVYDLKNMTEGETFPLQMGNGEYKISLLKNITDNKYAPISSDTVTLNLEDDKLVFLQSIQNISWTANTQAVKKAMELVKGFKNGDVYLDKIYEFVISNYRYDFEKAATVQTGYIPVVDDTYFSKKGICYDYSSMFAAMLRSYGIPTRLVKGYSNKVEGYHAWNEVYNEKTKSWIVIDTTYDAQLKLLKKKTELKKSTTDYKNVNLY